MLSFILCVLAIGVLAAAAPAPTPTQNLGIRFEDSEGELPILSLPYATYRAASYDVADDVCLSSGIRLSEASHQILTAFRSITSTTFVLRLLQQVIFVLQSLSLLK